MKRLAVFVALCLAVVAGLPWAYRLLYPIYVCRYRMTVDLVIGGRHYSGSSVVELRVKMQPRLLVSPLVAGERGEATVVDLGDGRALVAQLGYPVVFFEPSIFPTIPPGPPSFRCLEANVGSRCKIYQH
jgi:hypothetical protein